MELKPGYKQTEVGVIPDDWEVKAVDEIARVTSGKRMPLGTALTDRPNAHPYIRICDMAPGTVSTSAIMYVPDSVFPAIKRFRIFSQDIFISVAGSLGIVGKVPNELSGANLTENADRITDISCSQDYLLYFLMSPRIQESIDAIRTIGAQPKLALSRIRKFRIALPQSIAEQNRIAECLCEVDHLLREFELLITKKERIKQAVMQDLLTGKRRLPGFEGEWETIRLGDHVKYLKNGTNSRAELRADGRIKYLHYGDIHASSRSFASPHDLPSLPVAKAGGLDRLKDGDLIFADASEDITGVSKSVEIYDSREFEVVSGLHTIAARFEKSVLADGFKAFLQYIPSFSEHLRRLAAGTKVYATNRAHISSVEVKLPPVSEQRAISGVLSEMDAELAALEARRDKTRELKQGMMQELLTGRTRLK